MRLRWAATGVPLAEADAAPARLWKSWETASMLTPARPPNPERQGLVQSAVHAVEGWTWVGRSSC